MHENAGGTNWSCSVDALLPKSVIWSNIRNSRVYSWLTWVNPEFNIVINLPVAPFIHGSCRHTASQRVGQRGNLGLTVTGRVTRTTWRDEWGCWICMSATSKYLGGIDTTALSGRKAWGGSCVTAPPSKNKEMSILNHIFFQWMRFGELTEGLGLASSETEWNKC